MPSLRQGITGRLGMSELGFSNEGNIYILHILLGSEAVRRIDGDADSGTEKKAKAAL